MLHLPCKLICNLRIKKPEKETILFVFPCLVIFQICIKEITILGSFLKWLTNNKKRKALGNVIKYLSAFCIFSLLALSVTKLVGLSKMIYGVAVNRSFPET